MKIDTPAGPVTATIVVRCSECGGEMPATIETTFGPEPSSRVLVDWTAHMACAERIIKRGGDA